MQKLNHFNYISLFINFIHEGSLKLSIMKNKNSIWTIIILAGLFYTGCRHQGNRLSDKEIEDGWVLLFDGQTLEGWRDFMGDSLNSATWMVEKRTLSSQGTGNDSTGYIVTEKEYENFEICFDWKIAEGGNSGLLYHVLERPGVSVPYLSGPEFQIIDDKGFADPLEEWQKTAADYAMYACDPEKKVLKKAGEWNSSKIVFDNGHVEHWLNEQKVLEFEAWTEEWFTRKKSGKWSTAPEYGLTRSGHFALQDHGSRVWFRNMKLKELPRKRRQESLFNGKDLNGWDIYGTELWYVNNGELVCESGPEKEYGYLGTNKYYNDFDLRLEFKQESNGNSGIFVRSYIKSGIVISGWQVEIAQSFQDTGGIYESYGRGWIWQIPDEKEGILRENEWNTMRIRLVDNKITTWLNGELMTDLTDEVLGSGKGRIMLQIHSGGGIKVRWRNIHLTEL
jgi:hypothetical protein